jgi:3'-phosphoadenosine 5'-phosphosulfate sulfotransferase (PAPS reductase)/FAD synthetase
MVDTLPPHPPLEAFDIYHVGISGGKDSTALALWTWYESGLPHQRIRITFCDTDNEDALTYAFLALLRQHMPIEVIKPERGFYELARSKKRFPSTKARFCTQYLKVIPTREHLRALQCAGHSVVRFNGVRRAEAHSSNQRGAAALWEFHDGDCVWIHRPILFYTLEQVWELHRRYLSLDAVCAIVAADPTMKAARKAQLIGRLRRHGMVRNPLYDMGAVPLGCYPCINSRKAELRGLSRFRPERIAFLAEKERWVGEVNGGISTFFPRGYIPLHLHSQTVVIAGTPYQVPTIADVMNWAQTARGGRQYDIDWDDDDLPPASACDIGGLCE